MHLRKNDPDHHKSRTKTADLQANIGKSKKQPLDKKRTWNDQYHKENYAANHIVLRCFHIWIRARFEAHARARVFDKQIPFFVLHRLFSQVQMLFSLGVQTGHPLVFNRILRQFAHPRLVQRPHISCGLERRANKHPTVLQSLKPIAARDFHAFGTF